MGEANQIEKLFCNIPDSICAPLSGFTGPCINEIHVFIFAHSDIENHQLISGLHFIMHKDKGKRGGRKVERKVKGKKK